MKPALHSTGIRQYVFACTLCILSFTGLAIPPSLILPPAGFNNAPVAVDDYAMGTTNSQVTGNFIANDSDPDGDLLSVEGVTINIRGPHLLISTYATATGGSIRLYSDGTFSYLSPFNYKGNDDFTYTICDVNFSPLCATATIHIIVMTALALPVNLSQFNGKRSGKDNLLQWVTAQESNSDHFEVETGIDNNAFVKIASAPAKGYSNTTQSYNFVHRNSTASINYYRLKMVDKDGKAWYSKTLIVRSDAAGIETAVVYPNPFIDKAELVMNSSRAETVTLHIYDSKGMLRATQKAQTVKGLNVITINNPGNLQPGSYFLEAAGTVNVVKAKLVKGM
ncbi:MAG: Ig-like domain-containing protein [Ferruginibacter sp.]